MKNSNFWSLLKGLTFAILTISITNINAQEELQVIAEALVQEAQIPEAQVQEAQVSERIKLPAEWTIVTYIQADNNLAPFASYNINDMQVGMKSADQVNMLVQWDKPSDNKTWRYRIIPGGKVETGSLSSEMGQDPVAEIAAAMSWAKTNFPAKKYALILWNHGSGVEDFKNPTYKVAHMIHSWIHVPGGVSSSLITGRGILYDDSQGTCLTNPGLSSTLAQVKTILGKKVDLLGMDACLMAMLEIGYQMRDYVDYFVGSQQTEPGEGWAYSKWLAPLTTNPSSFDAAKLAQQIVTAYASFYSSDSATQDYTQSAIRLSALDALKQNVDQFVVRVNACKSFDATKTKAMIKAARNKSTEFYMPEYIDLYSFYAAMANQLGKNTPKSDRILGHHSRPVPPKPSVVAFKAACNNLKQTILAGMQLITTSVVANASGPEYANVKGISIYYPKYGTLHESYANTFFAQDTQWSNFLKAYRKRK